MNPQPNTSRGKRSSSTQEEVPTERRTVKKKKEERKNTSSSSSDSEDEEASRLDRYWYNIGDEEEMYLASTREELYELIMTKETFMNKVKAKKTGTLIGLTRSLLKYSQENIEELQMAQPEEVTLDPDERSRVGRFTSLVTFQHERIGWLAETFFIRYHKRWKELTARGLVMEELKKENAQLQESLTEMTRERDELRSKEAHRGRETRDVGVSTESEVPEVIMEEEDTGLSSSIQGIPPNLVGALEAIIEKKMEELLSRVGLPLEREKEDSLPPTSTGRVMEPQGHRDGAAPTSGETKLWSEVAATRRRKKPLPQKDSVPKRESKDGGGAHVPTVSAAGGDPKLPGKKRGRKGNRTKEWPKPPQSTAVVLTAPIGKESSCAELLRKARQEISLEEVGVPHLEIKKARTGGLILGVPGENSQESADRLAERLKGLASSFGVRVSRPTKTADIRVGGLDESTTPDEVVEAVAKLAGCRPCDIRSGQVQGSPTGMGSLWLQCPIDVAVKAAKAGKLRVGWAGASIEMLRPRPQRCYRCLEVGHLGARCTSKTDRALRCFRCGTPGHRAGDCREGVPRCPLCMDTERPHKHVLGGPGCDNSIPSSRNSLGRGREEEKADQDGRAASSSAG